MYVCVRVYVCYIIKNISRPCHVHFYFKPHAQPYKNCLSEAPCCRSNHRRFLITFSIFTFQIHKDPLQSNRQYVCTCEWRLFQKTNIIVYAVLIETGDFIGYSDVIFRFPELPANINFRIQPVSFTNEFLALLTLVVNNTLFELWQLLTWSIRYRSVCTNIYIYLYKSQNVGA